MAMRSYFILPRSPELEPQYQMKFSVIPRRHLGDRGSYPIAGDTVRDFLSPDDVVKDKKRMAGENQKDFSMKE